MFARLTVRENLEASAVGCGQSRRAAGRFADELLEQLGIAAFAHLRAEALPHGAERLAGVARALAGRPQFLLLDEPAAGLNDGETDELLGTLRELPARYELGLVVIEHDMRLIMRLCDRLHVLDHGSTIAVGPPDEVRANADVLQAYLGSAA
jgi:branched-chain amino acid transport system ATP-binding protein